MNSPGLECRTDVRHHRPSAAVERSEVRKNTREVTESPEYKKATSHLVAFRELAGARTRDPNIKSVVLYLLSYEFIVAKRGIPRFGGANVGIIFVIAK